MWPLKCTHGPGRPPSRRATRFQRGKRSLSPGVALGADEGAGEAGRGQPGGDQLADGAVVLARRVDRRDADERLGQRDEVVAPVAQRGAEASSSLAMRGMVHRARGLVQQCRATIARRQPRSRAGRGGSRRSIRRQDGAFEEVDAVRGVPYAGYVLLASLHASMQDTRLTVSRRARASGAPPPERRRRSGSSSGSLRGAVPPDVRNVSRSPMVAVHAPPRRVAGMLHCGEIVRAASGRFDPDAGGCYSAAGAESE